MRFVDRSRWAGGPWDAEPDAEEWGDPATGLPCMAHRMPHGHWSAMVGLRASAEYRGLLAREARSLFDVHGEIQAVLSRPDGSWPEGTIMLMFHCGHDGDLCPGDTFEYRQQRLAYPFTEGGPQYRTLEYVRNECSRLARQIVAHTKKEEADAQG